MTTQYRLNNLLEENIEQILDYFNADYKIYFNKIRTRCLVHDGPDENMTIYTGENSNWQCYSHHCEQQYGRGLFGLIKGILSTQEGIEVSNHETYQWIVNFFNISPENLEAYQENDTRAFIRTLNILNKENVNNNKICDRKTVRDRLKIPAQYFIERGFSPEILDRYDIGLCVDNDKEMYNRVVAPIYDENHEFVIACAGRSIFPQCKACKKFHYPELRCPSGKERNFSKWVYTFGFNGQSYLYNYWMSKKEIQRRHVAVLVEGQGDIWRLEEAGINLGLGLLGDALCSGQKILLEKSGVMDLIIATDNDRAGHECAQAIMNTCSNMYNCYRVVPEGKDIGDMTADQVKKLFNPVLEKLL